MISSSTRVRFSLFSRANNARFFVRRRRPFVVFRFGLVEFCIPSRAQLECVRVFEFAARFELESRIGQLRAVLGPRGARDVETERGTTRKTRKKSARFSLCVFFSSGAHRSRAFLCVKR